MTRVNEMRGLTEELARSFDERIEGEVRRVQEARAESGGRASEARRRRRDVLTTLAVGEKKRQQQAKADARSRAAEVTARRREVAGFLRGVDAFMAELRRSFHQVSRTWRTFGREMAQGRLRAQRAIRAAAQPERVPKAAPAAPRPARPTEQAAA